MNVKYLVGDFYIDYTSKWYFWNIGSIKYKIKINFTSFDFFFFNVT